MVALLIVFIIATLEKITLLGTRGPFGDNVFKNPAGCIHRELLYPTYPIEQNRTKNQSNPIELQSFDWVGQSNKIEQNRTNPMQLSLDASN